MSNNYIKVRLISLMQAKVTKMLAITFALFLLLSGAQTQQEQNQGTLFYAILYYIILKISDTPYMSVVDFFVYLQGKKLIA